MTKKYLMFSLDDEKTKHLSKVLGNKTCTRILEFLSETKSASEKDIADELKIPLNTAEYNLKKLIASGLVEKTKEFFWSKKGKKIPTYKVSNKSILISPKIQLSSKIKTILPVAILSGIGALIIRKFTLVNSRANDDFSRTVEFAAEQSSKIATDSNFLTTIQTFPIWAWFLLGAIFAIFIYALINWRKIQ